MSDQLSPMNSDQRSSLLKALNVNLLNPPRIQGYGNNLTFPFKGMTTITEWEAVPKLSWLQITDAMTSGDSISPIQTAVSRTEGESVTLSCSYTAGGQNIYLYWYRQNSNRVLEYILLKGAGSLSSLTFQGLYSESVRSQDQISQRPPSLTVSEGETATLHCNYTASNFYNLQWYRQRPNRSLENVMILVSDPVKVSQFSGSLDKYETSGSPELFWYIQEHNKAPELLLNQYLNDNPRFKERFSASHDKKTFNLTLSAAVPSDSATYFWLSYGDEVRPWKDLQTSEDTQETKIYCNYSLSNNEYTEYLFWYQQTPGRNPRYILHRYKASGGSAELRSEESDRRFISKCKLNHIKIEYLLANDYGTEMIQGDTVTQPSNLTLIKETGDTTIHCKYDFKSGSTPYLFWYIQDPNQDPQLILNEYSQQEEIPPRFQNRFSVSHDNTEKTFHLNITAAVLSDSATYFCALRPTL
ncbi:TVA1 protein, partial [Polyodon spathula]|nr:TVA1 protein [Polyodon spathula]